MTLENALNPWIALSPSRLHSVPWGLAFGLTDIDPVRTLNEDNFLIDEALGLVMVADGMGGHAAGAVASAAALTAVRQSLQRAALDVTSNEIAKEIANEITNETPGADVTARLDRRDPDATGSDPNSPTVAQMIIAVKEFNRYIASLCERLGHADRHAGLSGYCTGLMLRAVAQERRAHGPVWTRCT